MFKRFKYQIGLAVAAFFGATVALAAQAPLQWSYSFVSGITTATYPGNTVVVGTQTNAGTISTGSLVLPSSTVVGLPTCNAGAAGSLRIVTDANAPTLNSTLAGGGAVYIGARCNGTNWTAW